jgi:hypothetical protein
MKDLAGECSPATSEKAHHFNARSEASGDESPAALSGGASAKLAARKETDTARRHERQQQRAAARIKELQPEASNRLIAGVVGVDEATIRRDTAANAAPDLKNGSDINGVADGTAANDAPALSGGASAKLAARKETGAANRRRWATRRRGASVGSLARLSERS